MSYEQEQNGSYCAYCASCGPAARVGNKSNGVNGSVFSGRLDDPDAVVRLRLDLEDALATIARVKAVCDDWGAGTVHRPRSPYYARLRAVLETPASDWVGSTEPRHQ